ncbi:MAG: gas vesicle protein [Gemmatimonadetes bacterium]|nr:gas vesicle protein [Gemmatimonadota bacterium]
MPLKRLRSPGEYMDALDRVLDKGIVIDVSARVSVLAVDLRHMAVRVVVASPETYLRHGTLVRRIRSRPDPNRGGPDEEAP